MKTNIQVTSTVRGLFYYLGICYLEDNCWIRYWQKTSITAGQPRCLAEQERRRALIELYLENLREVKSETRDKDSTPPYAEVCEPCRQSIRLASWQLCARRNTAWEYGAPTCCCMTCAKVPNPRARHLSLCVHSKQRGITFGGFCARASPSVCLAPKHAIGMRNSPHALSMTTASISALPSRESTKSYCVSDNDRRTDPG